MAEETINEVIERVKARHADVLNVTRGKAEMYQVPTADMAALIAELETVRAQRDEYQEALESIRDAVSAIDTYDIDDDAMLVFIATVDEDTRAALNTQPQAEWTPRCGMRVITSNAAADDLRDITGTVHEETQPNHWMVKLDRRVVGYAPVVMFLASELAPVDESEA